MATLLKKRVAKYTLDITANATEATTYGVFVAADINTTANTITIESHKYKTGDLVACVSKAGIVAPTAPAIQTAYYVIVVDANTIALATSIGNAQAGTKLSLDATNQTGECYLVKQAFGTIVTDIVLPAGAVVTDAYYDVVTVFTGGNVRGTVNDDSTIALSTGVAKNDLVSAITIKDASNVWDAGVHGCLPGSVKMRTVLDDTMILAAAGRTSESDKAMIRVTTACNPTITIGAETLLGGKLELYIEYAA